MSESGEWPGIKAVNPVGWIRKCGTEADIPSQGADSCAALTRKVLLQLHFLQDTALFRSGVRESSLHSILLLGCGF